MSQIVRIHKTKMKDKELLIQAIRDAGYTCEEPLFPTLGRLGVTFKIRERQIGFKKTGNFYEMVSLRESQAPQILQEITQRYIYLVARQKLETQGFTIASEEKQKDGRIHLVLRRMA